MSSYENPSTDIPPDITPPEMWPEFGRITTPSAFCAREEVGTTTRGIRWSFWPFTFEDYVGDQEPDLSASANGRLARFRQILWRRAHRTDTPAGWREAARPWRVDGYSRLHENHDYTTSWSYDAQRNLRFWHTKWRPKGYSIAPVSMATFSAAYKKSTVQKIVGLELLAHLERQYALPESHPHITLYGVLNPEGQTIAGVAILFSPTHAASVHLCPFVLPEGRRVFAATALMEFWFEESKRRNTPLVYTTHFWQDGEPKDWIGFSEFKSHFGFTPIAYPPILTRWMRGKIF